MTRKKRYAGSSRDPGGFVILPWVVLDAPSYAALSYPAKALLIEVARQFHGDDNGRMILTRRYLAGRGWKSHDVVKRATDELIEAGFLYRTVMGARPNRAAWFAVTWLSLDRLDGYDPGAAGGFGRSAYQPKKMTALAR
jgi:hypothetical protein